MYTYKTFRGRQIDLGELTPLQLRLFLHCIKQAGGWPILGEIAEADVESAIAGFGKFAGSVNNLLDPSAFRKDWVDLFQHTLSEEDRRGAKASPLIHILEDMEFRLGALRLSWYAPHVRTDPRSFLRDEYEATGTLGKFCERTKLEKGQSSRLLKGILNDAKAPGVSKVQPDHVSVSGLRKALQATHRAIEFVDLKATHPKQKLSCRDHRMLAIGQRFLALYTGLCGSGIEQDVVHQLLQPEFAARAAGISNSLSATLGAAKQQSLLMGLPRTEPPLLLVISSDAQTADVDWIFIAIELRLFDDVGGLVSVVKDGDVSRSLWAAGEELPEHVRERNPESKARAEQEEAIRDVFDRLYEPARGEAAKYLTMRLNSDKEDEREYLLAKVRRRADRVLSTDYLRPWILPILGRWHASFSLSGTRANDQNNPSIRLWRSTTSAIQELDAITVSCAQLARHGSLTLTKQTFETSWDALHRLLCEKDPIELARYHKDGLVSAISTANDRELIGEGRLEFWKSLATRNKADVIGDSDKYALSKPLYRIIARGVASSTNQDGRRGEVAHKIDECYWALPSEQIIEKKVANYIRGKFLVGPEFQNLPFRLTKKPKINFSPYAESAYLTMLKLLYDELPSTRNSSGRDLILEDLSWESVWANLTHDKLDVAFFNDSMFQSGEPTEDKEFFRFGPVLTYKGYELVFRKDWLIKPEFYGDKVVGRLLQGETIGREWVDSNQATLLPLFRNARIAVPESDIKMDLGPLLDDVEIDLSSGDIALQKFLQGEVDIMAGGNNEVAYLQTFPEICTGSIRYGSIVDVFLWTRKGTEEFREGIIQSWQSMTKLWQWAITEESPGIQDRKMKEQFRKWLISRINHKWAGNKYAGGFLESFDQLSKVLSLHNELKDTTNQSWAEYPDRMKHSKKIVDGSILKGVK